MATGDHIRKKQFQQSISSYFDKQPRSQDNVSSPPLPAETQASLLNVGMRVRKSVPEGYKTHKTIMRHDDQIAGRPVMSQPTLDRWSSRELMPFSGIHKTGGYAQQSPWSSSAPTLMSKASFDSMPSLTTSQDTMSSASSFVCEDSSRKRGYEEEMEEDMDVFFEEMEREEGIAARKIAQPKSYSRRQRMLDILDNAGDFSEAPFLQPTNAIDMNVDYT